MIANNHIAKIIVLSLVLHTGCETVVDVEVPLEKPHVVANGIITPDSTWQIKLSKSRHILDDGTFEPITNAEVKIFSGDEPVATLNHQERGIYHSSGYPETGRNYTLKIDASGYEQVTAKTGIPQPVTIQNVTHDTTSLDFLNPGGSNLNNDSEQRISFKIDFQDPQTPHNYYMVEIFKTQLTQIIPPDYDGITPPIDSLEMDTVMQPLNISSNDPVIANESNNSGDYLIFSDQLINGKNYGLRVILNSMPYGNPGNEESNKYYINLSSITREYYNYLHSTRLQRSTSGNPFAEPVQVFSNIENGLGIFAGYQTDQYIYELQSD